MHKNWRRRECDDEDGVSEDALVMVVAIFAIAMLALMGILAL